jgi:hypothetical protein
MCGHAVPSESHHVFGRRNVVGEPLASHHTFLAGLCRECHHEVTVHPGSLKERLLMAEALTRAYREFDITNHREGDDMHTSGRKSAGREDLCGEARWIEDQLRADPDRWHSLLVAAGMEQ